MKTTQRSNVGSYSLSIVADWLALLRPKIAAMVVLTAVIGGVLAGGVGALERALEAALYIALVTGAASVFNQVLERETDGLMERTRHRPLPAGRIGASEALAFGVVLGVAGVAGLLMIFGLLAAFLALATLCLYVIVYTPLKRISSLNTAVGAVPGAAPPLLGYVAVADQTGPWAWALFSILFAWQFPHFMAIAWLYREDYRRAGMRMIPALPNSEGVAGRQAVVYSAALLPVAMLPFMHGMAGVVYGVLALGLGLLYLGASIRFALREDRPRARALMLVSLVYLPVLFGGVLLDPIVRATLAG